MKTSAHLLEICLELSNKGICLLNWSFLMSLHGKIDQISLFCGLMQWEYGQSFLKQREIFFVAGDDEGVICVFCCIGVGRMFMIAQSL